MNPETEITRLRAEVERLQVQLAGCLAAAEGVVSVAQQGDYGWSLAYQTVVKIRRERDEARARVEELVKAAWFNR